VDEYQLNDLLINQQGLLVQGMALFVSILSGFLLLTYLVGKKLNRQQVIAVSAMYLVTASITAWMVARWGYEAGQLGERLEALESSVVAPTPPDALLWVLTSLFAAAVLLPLLYMWTVRRGLAKQ
jgi:hypothetical protein